MSRGEQTTHRREHRLWGGVVSLGLGIFSIAMSQFLPTSLLPLIAEGLQVSIGAAGQSFTATAIAATLSALFIPVMLSRSDRRRVMLGLTALAVIGNVLTALTPGLAVLLLARCVLGVALGGFWAMGIAVTAQLVPPSRLGSALAVVNAGVPVATGVAIPLGAWLGDIWGWRGVFALAAACAVVALMVQAATLPSLPARHVRGLSALGAALRSRIVRLGLVATMLIYAGHFVGYPFFRPIVVSLARIDTGAVATLLLVFGITNFVGTALAGPLADRTRRAGVLLYPAVLGAGMLLMLVVGNSLPGLLVTAMLWGFGFGGVATSLQIWGARTEPVRLEQIGSLLVMAANAAVAVGAAVGGILIDTTSGGSLLLVGGVVAVLGGLLVSAPRRRARP
ncbi:MFS transporter [Microbacterium sp. MAHUQ-60]|uniref:MFS transporter n=1 Tax=unclassified Microbacterium TaxID=2609290 RepID=UPI00361E171B